MNATKRASTSNLQPVVVGATGGSGTRVLGNIFQRAGGYLGWNLNKASDSLCLAPFFQENFKEAYNHLISGNEHYPANWKAEFTQVMSQHLSELGETRTWGWKNPSSMIFLPFLRSRFPNLRFVHLIRDGRDAAMSRNANQFNRVHVDRTALPTIEERAAFWAETNLAVQRYAILAMPSDYLCLRFEDLCASPAKTARSFLQFAGLPPVSENILLDVKPPKSIGRYLNLDSDEIDRLTSTVADALETFEYK